ncbi:MAG: nitrogenase component 1 [Lachnospiraceae bacterium]|nr:nitrogenase component 1 [Lachnospiraceae bacterium]
MRETYKIVPVYSGDVSGACSALYELEGMVVMHDPSGCNSTYNTFDENRWYEKESLIFLSGLTDTDAIMGNDKKLIDDILEAAKELKPKFVAITNSPIPYLNGTDFDGICRKIENELGIPAFYIPSNGMHDYTIGAGKALMIAAKKLMKDKAQPADIQTTRSEAEADNKATSSEAEADIIEIEEIKVNLVGITPLDYSKENAVSDIKEWLRTSGFTFNSSLSLDTSYDEFVNAPDADVNLVLSSVGMECAIYMNEKYGIPYVVGSPIGDMAKFIAEDIRESHENKKNNNSYKRVAYGAGEGLVKLIGEPVFMGSMAASIHILTGRAAQVIVPTEYKTDLLSKGDIAVTGEEEIEQALHADKDRTLEIIGDGMYTRIAPEGVRFINVPHLALSGRMYQNYK